MKHLGLFEGIGGFSLAARWAGWETPVMVEWNPYCQAVLKKNFPDATIFGDIRQFDGTAYAGQIDIITGGFPCQPFSHAGKREGTDDDRYLWPEMLRIIREVEPALVVGENVAGILTMDGGRVFAGILADLENEGYSTEVYLIPAVGVGAPHRRDRVWIVAHAERQQGIERRQSEVQWRRANEAQQIGVGNRVTANAAIGGRKRRQDNERQGQANGIGFEKCDTRVASDASKQGLQGGKQCRSFGERQGPPRPVTQQDCNGWREHWYEVATRICRVDDGLSAGMDGIGDVPKATTKGKAHRLEALGNAIVPQIALQIFNAINMAEDVII